jgi:hypothetical protein
MFFYFNNQITYQNNKLNTMFGIVTDMIQKDIQPLNIPLPSISDPTQNIFQIPGSSNNLIEVSDSDSDDEDEDEDEDDEEHDELPQIIFTSPLDVNEDTINIQLLDITDVTEVNDDVKVFNMEVEVDFKPGDKTECDIISSEEIVENHHTDDLNITIIHSEPKHSGGSLSNHHKSLHVNELRKMAVQLQLIPQVEAKKLKKDELVDLLGKSTEAKQD